MRFETTELPAVEASQSSTHDAFASELFNSTGDSPSIAMCPAEASQNKTPPITDQMRSSPNGFDICPWIPNGQLIRLLEQEKGLPGG
ncbi:MAG: hypothetical protein Q8T09_01960 [Candidatus Melainabacteria bacterium]|nr:hypothetical protein [Candidatus Melainabacteria bacterium]